MHTPGSEQIGRSRSLKRRSPGAVRKGDIRIVSGSAEGAATGEFTPAQSMGSGDNNDVCFQRLQAWQHMVENYQEYFRSMAAAERDLATVYARVGDILKVPADEGVLLLAADSDGVQGIGRRLKAQQQQMVEAHCAISDTLKHGALAELNRLHADVVDMRDTYTGAVHGLHSQLTQSRTVIAKRTQLLDAAIAAAHSGHTQEVAKDPFIINLEVAALLRKHADTSSQLHAMCVAQHARLGEFEPQLVERLGAVVSEFMDVASTQYKQLRLTAKRDMSTIACMDGGSEWAHFQQTHGHVVGATQDTMGLATDGEYVGQHSAWVRVLRQGVVALKEHGPLFRSTWQSKYGVLTTRGYFHVFRSQGDVVRGAPETSIFLPRARIAGGGTLQISCGSRFSRSRIVIQDSVASLDNWRMLMEAACNGAGAQVEPGLATPDSSADESPLGSRERNIYGVARRSAARSRRRSVAAVAPCSTSITPTRGRPFSADVSMLAQTPTPFARTQNIHKQTHRVSFTPTQDIYMQPLGATPASPPAFAHVPYGSPMINAGAEFAAYSPGFSDSPASAVDSSDEMMVPSSSSSGAPNQHESLFEHNMSQDSESAPIASLPKLHCKRYPPHVFQEPFPDADEQFSRRQYDGLSRQYELDEYSSDSYAHRGLNQSSAVPFEHHGPNQSGSASFVPNGPNQSSSTSFVHRELGCDASIHSAEPMRRGGSIIDLQVPRVFSSSTGFVPAHGYNQDIWHSDLLSVPDSAVRMAGTRQRPRSMIYSGSESAVLDPHNPYLGDFLAKRNVRDTRVGSRASSASTGQQTTLWRSSAGSTLGSNVGMLHPRVVSQPAEVGPASPPL
ncbi:hypothetical protein GGH19_004969 [Coemansia sp. RSA 1807]|nr:hypothetical protein GGH19_004969 [Coemansia sp. RSA 1807]